MRPMTLSACASAEEVSSESSLVFVRDALLDLREGRELRHELASIHRLGGILVLQLRDEQLQERVVVERRRADGLVVAVVGGVRRGADVAVTLPTVILPSPRFAAG